MPKLKLAEDLAEALRLASTTIPDLQEIGKLAVISHGADASGAIDSGGVLLGISRVDNDDDGDGFRYLVGLRRNVQMTPYLSNFFG